MPEIARQRINLTSREYRAEPFESFRRLREMGPLVPARLPLIGNIWLATSYEAVDELLKNDKLFCRDPRNAGKSNYWFFQLLMPGLFRHIANNMIAMDEPDHRRLRTLVDQAFQRQSIANMRPRIEQLVDEQLDSVQRMLDEDRQADLVEHLCRTVPLSVICELLGLPLADRPKFRQWFSSFANIRSFWGIVKVVPGLRKTVRYLRGQFEEVKRQPRAGLMTALVEAEQEGDRLSENELIAMVMLLLLAGHETTVHLLSNSVLTVLQLDEVRHELLEDWSKVEPAVEEMLRYNSPAQFAKPRFLTVDTEFHGQQLRRGESVMPVLASANYDPQRFENPHMFQIDRPRNYHLGFGAGPHVCLGLKLARAETQIVLQRMFTRWPELTAAFDPGAPDWSKRIGMRSLNTLTVARSPGQTSIDEKSRDD